MNSTFIWSKYYPFLWLWCTCTLRGKSFYFFLLLSKTRLEELKHDCNFIILEYLCHLKIKAIFHGWVTKANNTGYLVFGKPITACEKCHSTARLMLILHNYYSILILSFLTYRIANSDRSPLEVGPKFLQLRESVVHCELLMLRVLGFCVAFDNPHKVLLDYITIQGYQNTILK